MRVQSIGSILWAFISISSGDNMQMFQPTYPSNSVFIWHGCFGLSCPLRSSAPLINVRRDKCPPNVPSAPRARFVSPILHVVIGWRRAHSGRLGDYYKKRKVNCIRGLPQDQIVTALPPPPPTPPLPRAPVPTSSRFVSTLLLSLPLYQFVWFSLYLSLPLSSLSPRYFSDWVSPPLILLRLPLLHLSLFIPSLLYVSHSHRV